MYCGGVQHDDGPTAGEDEDGEKIEEEEDDDCDYFRKHDATWKPGMPGLTSGLFFSEFLAGSSYETTFYWRKSIMC